MNNKIALLATGDEIVNGDILNTNSQTTAQKLTENGFVVGMHASAGDHDAEIIAAMHFLLQHHQALIITGGLGPTSDDRTRFCLSDAVNKPLEFNAESWQRIQNRFKELSYGEIPASNKQQCLFPQGATVYPNYRGTADACKVEYQGKIIYMLPGPPHECLKILDDNVIPDLQQQQQIKPSNRIFLKWRLFGIGEGSIAEELDALMQDYDCETGYRAAFPFIEFKLNIAHGEDVEHIRTLVEDVIAPYLICTAKHTASELFCQALTQQDTTIVITDEATGGLLATSLLTPETHSKLLFTHHRAGLPANADDAEISVHITGLDEFWQSSTNKQTKFQLHWSDKHEQKIIEEAIPYRNRAVRHYAIELICYHLLELLRQLKEN